MLTDQEIAKNHQQRCQELFDAYGSLFSVPKNELSLLNEKLRAEYVVQAHQKKGLTTSVVNSLREHGIYDSVIKEMTGENPEHERRQKRVDKYKTIFDWCAANSGKITNAQEIAAIGNFSVSTATTLLKDRLDFFTKIKRGEYLVRNPAVERAEKFQDRKTS